MYHKCMRDLEILIDKEHEYLRQYIVGIYSGYAFVRIDGKRDALHRVIMGRQEGCEVDHINRVKLDNRLINLRFLTHQENLRNRKGWGKLPKGVYLDKTLKRAKPYKVMRRINGKNVSYGYYSTIQEAAMVSGSD